MRVLSTALALSATPCERPKHVQWIVYQTSPTILRLLILLGKPLVRSEFETQVGNFQLRIKFQKCWERDWVLAKHFPQPSPNWGKTRTVNKQVCKVTKYPCTLVHLNLTKSLLVCRPMPCHVFWFKPITLPKKRIKTLSNANMLLRMSVRVGLSPSVCSEHDVPNFKTV